MATNDFPLFADDGGANKLSNSGWNSETALRTSGFQSGIAESVKANTIWHKAMYGTAALARLMQQNDIDALDTPGGLDAFVANLVKALQAVSMPPVGSVLIMATTSDPNASYPGTTWVVFATGRTLVGYSAAEAEFNTIGETGGEKTHTLSTAELPAHQHKVPITNVNGGGSTLAASYGATYEATSSRAEDPSASGDSTLRYLSSNTGGGGAHNNLQPYIVVQFWRRTA